MTLNEFEDTVLECLGTTREKLLLNNKSESVAMRSVVFYFLKKHTNLALGMIGDRYHKQHSTVIHALENFDYYRNYDKAIKIKIEALEEKFKNLSRIIVCKECGREV